MGYSDEIYFGTFRKETFWGDPENLIDENLSDSSEKIILLSEKVKIRNKIIQIPAQSTSYEKESSIPRSSTSNYLILNDQIFLFRDGQFYVTKKFLEDTLNSSSKITSINHYLGQKFARSDSEYPIPWFQANFKNLNFKLLEGKYLAAKPPTILF